jgi:hypothetical protein
MATQKHLPGPSMTLGNMRDVDVLPYFDSNGRRLMPKCTVILA